MTRSRETGETRLNDAAFQLRGKIATAEVLPQTREHRIAVRQEAVENVAPVSVRRVDRATDGVGAPEHLLGPESLGHQWLLDLQRKIDERRNARDDGRRLVALREIGEPGAQAPAMCAA